jgi:hypothetical protein
VEMVTCPKCLKRLCNPAATGKEKDDES